MIKLSNKQRHRILEILSDDAENPYVFQDLTLEDIAHVYKKGYMDAFKELRTYRFSDLIKDYLTRCKQLKESSKSFEKLDELIEHLEQSVDIITSNKK
mgnify:CR=1 FL=1